VLPVLPTVNFVMSKLMDLKLVLNAFPDFILMVKLAQAPTAMEPMEKYAIDAFMEKY
jgi:hypothetical protein